MPLTQPLLADSRSAGSILAWSILLLLLLVIMFGGIGFLRKWLTKNDQPTNRLGFTLGDLRRLRDQGQLSEEEYERARNQMIAATQRAAEQALAAAQKEGVASAPVTDVEAIRRRAREYRQGANLPPRNDEQPPAADPPG